MKEASHKRGYVWLLPVRCFEVRTSEEIVESLRGEIERTVAEMENILRVEEPLWDTGTVELEARFRIYQEVGQILGLTPDDVVNVLDPEEPLEVQAMRKPSL